MARLTPKERTVAVIREDACIGCTKCIQACPFDAILGSEKLMHTVIQIECTGCELCVPVCPMDCIDLFPVKEEQDTPGSKTSEDRKNLARMRVKARNKRLAEEAAKEKASDSINTLKERKHYIEAALKRVKARKW